MKLYKEQIELTSHGKTPSYFDITPQVKEAIAKSGVKEGICTVLTAHTTCSVFFEEYAHDRDENGDESLQHDLNIGLAKIFPDHVDANTYTYPGEEHYKAVESWPNAKDYLPNGRQDLWNGDAHLRSTLLGSSEVFDVTEGKLGVGSTGYVYFADFDRTRGRQRRCVITVLGE